MLPFDRSNEAEMLRERRHNAATMLCMRQCLDPATALGVASSKLLIRHTQHAMVPPVAHTWLR